MFALFLKSFLKLLFNTKGRIPLPTVVSKNAQGLGSRRTFLFLFCFVVACSRGPVVRPSSFCLGLVHPMSVATARMVEAEARTWLDWRPLQPQRWPIATVPSRCTFAWLLPPDSRELTLEKGRENGFRCKFKGRKWWTCFVLSRFQKHLKCMELHNTIYCSEAAGGEKVLFNNILA